MFPPMPVMTEATYEIGLSLCLKLQLSGTNLAGEC